MGAAPSKPARATLDEKLAESVRALRMEHDDEGFVHVCGHEAASRDVSVARLGDWERAVLREPKNRLALAALSAHAPATVLTSRATVVADTQTFNVKIPLEGAPITNQRASGRCWLFASTNVFRVALMRRHNLKEFEVSQAYLFFWDKVEKANFFLEQVLDTLDHELDGRLLQALLASPVGDGGQWDMVASLVDKYGLVPQPLYPDSFNAQNSAAIGQLITTKLREDALRLRSAAAAAKERGDAGRLEDLRSMKGSMVRDVHRILTLTLGPPPSPDASFSWEHYDADGKFKVLSATPREFARELSTGATVRACGGTDVQRLFSLVNDPRNPYGELLSVSRLGNVVGGRAIRYVNVDMKVRSPETRRQRRLTV